MQLKTVSKVNWVSKVVLAPSTFFDFILLLLLSFISNFFAPLEYKYSLPFNIMKLIFEIFINLLFCLLFKWSIKHIWELENIFSRVSFSIFDKLNIILFIYNKLSSVFSIFIWVIFFIISVSFFIM